MFKNIMEDYILSIIITLFVCAVVYFGIKYFYGSSESSIQNIISTIQDGKTEIINTGNIQPSKNQKGLEFSYIGWVFIDDFTYRYGEPKIVFTKGTPDLKIACPALIIDGNTNSFLVYVDTYGTQEIVPISNITAKKWMHFAIVVDQYSINIYINGVLHTHHTMNQLPRQNGASLITSPKGGFNGKIGLLQYYPRILEPSEVSVLSINPPEMGKDIGIGILPPYYDTKWWFKNEQR